MRITSSGEVLVIGAELLVDVEAVDVGVSMVGESMAITLSWVRFPFSGSWSRVLPYTLLGLKYLLYITSHCRARYNILDAVSTTMIYIVEEMLRKSSEAG